MRKSDYLARQKMLQSAFIDAGIDIGFQKCFDLMCVVLHDPEVMGRDAFGKERIKKVMDGLVKWEKFFHDAWALDDEADYLQEKLDVLLRDIFGEESEPFAVRYPDIKRPKYDKR